MSKGILALAVTIITVLFVIEIFFCGCVLLEEPFLEQFANALN